MKMLLRQWRPAAPDLPSAAMGTKIIGSGIAEPALVVTNDDLARIMDTSDEWITSRSGVRQRRFVSEDGIGASDLAVEAANAALENARVDIRDIDLLVTATMTPDFYAPGIAPLVQDKLGANKIAAFDIRHQCSGFLYGLDLADAMLSSGRARTALVVGAEVHGGYLPFGASWDILNGADQEPTPEDWAAATAVRAWGVLFGDGAGAMVLGASNEPGGFGERTLHTDGSMFDLIHVPGAGHTSRPWLETAHLEAALHVPQMNGAGLFKNAVRLMPEAVRAVLAEAGKTVDDLDLVISHQANDRITQAMRKELGVSREVVPSNIAMHGNTTAGTLPILFHDLATAGRIIDGQLLAFTSFGAGAHWGAMLYRV